MVEKVDKESYWPEEGIRALLDSGLGGLTVPRELGGLGHGMYGLALTSEILGQACPSTALCFGMHSVAAAVIAAKATQPQIDDLLEPITKGKHLTTLALSEPGTGGHFYYPETRMTREGDGSRLNGVKSFVTNGGHADSYVMSVASDAEDAGPGRFSCVVVRADTRGLEWGPPWSGLGMRGNSSRNLTLNDAPIGPADVLGAEGDEIWYVFNVIAPYFLVSMAGVYLGISETGLRKAKDHLMSRRYSHSGTGPAAAQVVQARLGTMWARIERTRRLIYAAAAAGDEGREDALPMLVSSKAEVAETAVATINDAMTLMGGIAYARGADMERLLRDARAADVMAPSTDLLRIWTGRWLLGIPLLSE